MRDVGGAAVRSGSPTHWIRFRERCRHFRRCAKAVAKPRFCGIPWHPRQGLTRAVRVSRLDAGCGTPANETVISVFRTFLSEMTSWCDSLLQPCVIVRQFAGQSVACRKPAMSHYHAVFPVSIAQTASPPPYTQGQTPIRHLSGMTFVSTGTALWCRAMAVSHINRRTNAVGHKKIPQIFDREIEQGSGAAGGDPTFVDRQAHYLHEGF